MQISARWVLPVTSTRRLRNSRSTSHNGAASPGRRRARERDLQFIELIVARFVEARRLTGRTDEQPGKQIRKRRMALPIEDQARQQIGPAQERRIGRHGAAEHDVVAAAGAGVAPVGHELVRAEPRLARVFIEHGRRLHRLAPRRGGMDIDLDDAGIGRHLDAVDARVERRRVALDADRDVLSRARSLRPCRAIRDNRRASASAA